MEGLGLFVEYLQGEELMAEKSRNGTSFILKDQHLTFREMPGRAGGNDLESDIVKLDLEVLGDDAGIVYREEEIQIDGPVKGDVSVTGRTGKDSELAVVCLNELGKKGISIEVILDVAESHFLDEAVLEGLVGTFDTSFGLRGVGTDEVYPEAGQSTVELGDSLFMDTALGIGPENAEFITVEGNWKAGGAEVGLTQPGVGKEALMFHKFSSQDRAGGIIHEQDQAAFGSPAFQPGVVGTIDLDQFSAQETPFPLRMSSFLLDLGMMDPNFDHDLTQGFLANHDT